MTLVLWCHTSPEDNSTSPPGLKLGIVGSSYILTLVMSCAPLLPTP